MPAITPSQELRQEQGPYDGRAPGSDRVVCGERSARERARAGWPCRFRWPEKASLGHCAPIRAIHVMGSQTATQFPELSSLASVWGLSSATFQLPDLRWLLCWFLVHALSTAPPQASALNAGVAVRLCTRGISQSEVPASAFSAGDWSHAFGLLSHPRNRCCQDMWGPKRTCSPRPRSPITRKGLPLCIPSPDGARSRFAPCSHALRGSLNAGTASSPSGNVLARSSSVDLYS